ncbi:hypothetical protein KJA16_02195 [Patescibacteria group bacterium]|nr:hypothetical protein [Patescibacteria group bacterium]
MFFKAPKNSKKISWTKHVEEKMKFYQLSERRLKRLFRNPKRIEKGIVPGTIAIMQPAGTKKHPTEIWLMYQKLGKKMRIITAWRYPGISPIREAPPIPEDILKFLWKLRT